MTITDNQELHIQISDGGSEYWHVQALYPNLPLIQGREYLFEFDAYSSGNKLFEAEVKKENLSY